MQSHYGNLGSIIRPCDKVLTLRTNIVFQKWIVLNKCAFHRSFEVEYKRCAQVYAFMPGPICSSQRVGRGWVVPGVRIGIIVKGEHSE